MPDTLRIRLIFGAAIIAAVIWGGTTFATEIPKTLRVCIWPEYHSITYRNPKTAQLDGIDIVLSQRFAESVGSRVDYIESSFATLIPDLLNRRCDIAMFGIAAIPERKARLAFSKAYLRGEILAATTKQNSRIKSWNDIDRPGNVVAVQAGTYMEPVMRRALKNADLNVVSPPTTRENEIRSGRADVFMTDFPYAKRLVENEDWIRIIQPPGAFFPIDYAYAVAPDNSDLLRAVNGFVLKIRADGALRETAAKYGLTPMIPESWNDQ